MQGTYEENNIEYHSEWLTPTEISTIVISNLFTIKSKLCDYKLKNPKSVSIIPANPCDHIFLRKEFLEDFIEEYGFYKRDKEYILKTSDWLSVCDLKQIFSNSTKEIRERLTEIRKIYPDKITEVLSHKPILCLHKDFLDDFIKISGLKKRNIDRLEKKSKDWLNSKELRKEIIASPYYILKKLKELQASYPEYIKVLNSEGHELYCLNKNYINEFIRLSGLKARSSYTPKSEEKPELPAYTKEQIELIFGRKIHDKIVYKGRYKKTVEEALKKAEEIEQRKMSVYISQESKMH